MKQLVVLLFLVFSTFSNAQIFHFDTQTTVLNKTTDESPAHWYLEIFNDVGVDSTLRWKAFFVGVPSVWQITFEDQTEFHQGVLDGDSADFAFPVTGTFPQKLIIGAHTNNTPANATVYFEIFDPNTPTQRDTIGYIFNITQGTNSIYELQKQGVLEIKGGTLYIKNSLLSDFKVIDAKGRIVAEAKQKLQLDLTRINKNELYFIQIIQTEKSYYVKFVR